MSFAVYIVTLVLSCQYSALFFSHQSGVSAFSFAFAGQNYKYRYQNSGSIIIMSATESTQKNEIKYGGLHHIGVLVNNIEKSKDFYVNVFGFSDDSALRSKSLPFAGNFMKVGEHQIHLMELPNPDPIDGRPEHGGRDRHVALTINNLDPLIAKLNHLKIFFTLSKSGRRALFCRDLDGNAFEFVENIDIV
jgi:glyoxylase I family protein